MIGRFELVRVVGRGGFGVVYEARDRELGRAVAFKAVRPGRRVDLRRDGLLREAEATARLSHPNIVTLYDVGQCEHGPYLILELLRGQPLSRRLEQGPLPVPEALRVAAEVARGLAHAHRSGVVHRDLTPGNVFLCDDGQVKVLDLGLAHAFGCRQVDGGTPEYMGPEQRCGAPEDERTDVFALGVIIFELLAGRRPTPEAGGTPARPVPLLEVADAPALGAFVARMLEHDPVRRPRDAGEVLAALDAFRQELERSPSAGRAAPVVRARWPRRRLAALAAGGVLALLTAGGWMARGVVLRPARPAPSIAVLPFADLSERQDQGYFSDGLAEEILTALGSIEGLRVPGRTSSFSFKKRSATLADIGRELGVGAVLEGSVRRAGSRVRVTAQIVNVSDGYRLWNQAFDRELTDIFAVQEEIARAVAGALDVKLMGRGAPSIRAHATPNAEVYSQYLLGRQALRELRGDGFQRAVEAFERALALDPGYAPAWAGLAFPAYVLSDGAGSPAAIQAGRRRALAAAERAVALAPALPEALSARGFMRGYVDFDWVGSKADMERAIALNGNDADSRRRHAILLEGLGRLPEALAEARLATGLDPLGSAWTTLGTIYQSAGQLEQAEAAFHRQLQVTPESIAALFGLIRNLVLQGKPKEALEVNARLPDEGDRLWGRALAEHQLGHPEASQVALDAFITRGADSMAYDIAAVLAHRGETDQAFKWLERSLAQREAGMFGGLRSDPFLRSLRDDPRFEVLLRRMKAPAGGASR